MNGLGKKIINAIHISFIFCSLTCLTSLHVTAKRSEGTASFNISEAFFRKVIFDDILKGFGSFKRKTVNKVFLKAKVSGNFPGSPVTLSYQFTIESGLIGDYPFYF